MLRSIWQVTGRYSRKANSSAGLSLDVFENNRYTSRLARNFALKIHKICITGGPCAGKTTAIETLVERLMGEYCVIDVPELATIKIKSGQKLLVNGPPKEQFDFSLEFMRSMMSFEDSHMEKVSNDPREEAVVIFDRGVMDNLAYMTPESRDYFRKHCGMDMDQLRDTRYDMVIHMVTAADGAEKFYTLENNRARSESPARAKEIDMLIRQQWAGHKKMIVVGNESDFNSKVNTVHKHILSHLCMPTSAVYPSKFLLPANFSTDSIPKEIVRHKFHESIFILKPSDSPPGWAKGHKGDILSYLKIRRSTGEARSIRLSHTFRLTSESKKIERKSLLSREEFLDTLTSDLDQTRVPVVKQIESFRYKSTAYTLESLNISDKIIRFLRVESDSPDPAQLVPSFINIEGDVSNDPKYFIQNLSQVGFR